MRIVLKIKHRLSLSLENSLAFQKFIYDAFSGFLYKMSLETSM